MGNNIVPYIASITYNNTGLELVMLYKLIKWFSITKTG